MTDCALVEIVDPSSSVDAAEVVADERAAWLGICASHGANEELPS